MKTGSPDGINRHATKLSLDVRGYWLLRDLKKGWSPPDLLAEDTLTHELIASRISCRAILWGAQLYSHPTAISGHRNDDDDNFWCFYVGSSYERKKQNSPSVELLTHWTGNLNWSKTIVTQVNFIQQIDTSVTSTVATAILSSTRGTAGSEERFKCSLERAAVPRCLRAIMAESL